MNPPAFKTEGGNINTFFAPHTKPGSQPILTYLSTVSSGLIGKL